MSEMETNRRAYMGIDPGKSGAVALIDPGGEVHFLEYLGPLSYLSLMKDARDMFDLRIVVERLTARPGKFSSAKANFELGRCMGELETMLGMLDMPFQEVTPQAWQKEYGITGDKQTHIDFARRLFPKANLKRTEKCKVDFDGYADALLMAEYARRHMA